MVLHDKNLLLAIVLCLQDLFSGAKSSIKKEFIFIWYVMKHALLLFY